MSLELQQSSFGLRHERSCTVCSQPLSGERLAALPMTDVCTTCQVDDGDKRIRRMDERYGQHGEHIEESFYLEGTMPRRKRRFPRTLEMYDGYEPEPADGEIYEQYQDEYAKHSIKTTYLV